MWALKSASTKPRLGNRGQQLKSLSHRPAITSKLKYHDWDQSFEGLGVLQDTHSALLISERRIMRDEQAKTDITTEEIFSQRRLGSSVARHMVRNDGSGAAQEVHAHAKRTSKKRLRVPSQHHCHRVSDLDDRKTSMETHGQTVRETRW